MGPDRTRRTLLCISALACALCLPTSSAWAATTTVGQLAQPGSTTNCNGRTFLGTGVSSGVSYTVPVAGVITSWSFWDGATTITGLKLKVGRPNGGHFTIVGSATAGPQAGLTINTYTANIPVQAGDVIGIYSGSLGDCLLDTGNTSDTFSSETGDIGTGTNLVPDLTGSGARLPVSVQVQPLPGIDLISPSSGLVTGGTSVTIAGHDLAGATAVSFGATPAASFVVNSDNSITAVSPSVAAAGPVDVRVTTVAGMSAVVAADAFTYLAVPSPPSPPPPTPSKPSIKDHVKSHSRTASFSFSASDASGFQCALVKLGTGEEKHEVPTPHFSGCTSSKKYKKLGSANYMFEVRGTNAGNTGSVAKKSFKI